MTANGNAIVIVIDRLGAGFLGPYGNTWCETPAFNRLATQSLLWENFFAESPTLEAFYRSIATGTHPFSVVPDANEGGASAEIAAKGVRTVLVTDAAELDELPFFRGFTDKFLVPSLNPSSPAAFLEETQTAHTFAAALEYLDQLGSPYLLWVHCRGMEAAWDAPRGFRERFADEEDPPPPETIEPPNRSLASDVDPDELLGLNQAYAGQVMVHDLCLATFLEALESDGGHGESLVVITSPRGYPLGEHGAVGRSGDGLHEESVHLPLFVRVPGGQGAMQRMQSLASPTDLHAMLSAWFGLAKGTVVEDAHSRIANFGDTPERRILISGFQNARSLRSRGWLVIHTPDDPPTCYVKPDDRWEVNEVGNRRSDIVDQALQALTAFSEAVVEGRAFDESQAGALLFEWAE